MASLPTKQIACYLDYKSNHKQSVRGITKTFWLLVWISNQNQSARGIIKIEGVPVRISRFVTLKLLHDCELRKRPCSLQELMALRASEAG